MPPFVYPFLLMLAVVLALVAAFPQDPHRWRFLCFSIAAGFAALMCKAFM